MCLSFRSPDMRLSTHVRLELRWDFHAAVGFLELLEERHEESWRRESRVVERVAELYVSIGITVAQVRAARLPVVQVRARVRFAVRAFAWDPRFDIEHLVFPCAHVARADFDDTVMKTEVLKNLFRRLEKHLVVLRRFSRIVFAHDVLLNFVELVHADKTANIATRAPRFSAETRAHATVEHRKLRFSQNFVGVKCVHWDFGSSRKIDVVGFEVIDLLFAGWEVACSREGEFACHCRNRDEVETFRCKFIESKSQERHFEKNEFAFESVASRACDFCNSLKLGPIMHLEKFDVVFWFEAELRLLPPLFYFNVS